MSQSKREFFEQSQNDWEEIIDKSQEMKDDYLFQSEIEDKIIKVDSNRTIIAVHKIEINHVQLPKTVE